jgi:magnesium transporter
MLINCVVYQKGRKLADVPKEQISDWIARPDCFVWVGLAEPAPEEIDEMAAEFGLHPLAVEDARKGHQRPKIEEYEDCLFVVMHTIETTSEAPDAGFRVGEIDVFAGSNYILSVRHRAKKGFAEVRARSEREPELLERGAGYVLYALMDSVVDRYFPILDQLENELERSEEALFDDASSGAKIEALYGLKRRLMLLRHAVTPLMDALGKLHGGRVPPVVAGLNDYFRDVHDHLARINGEIESIREMVTTAIQVNFALIGVSDNQVTKRLAAYGALITVPTLIAGIYGMNFHHMPELDWTIGYPLAMAVMAAVDVVLFVKFRKAGWI